jgi:mediator of RNA polymerase II transcription subunit 14
MTDDGRVFFSVPNLFEAAICLLGQEKTDSWFFTNVEFLFNVGGDSVDVDGNAFGLIQKVP